jgi:hypothetical protein
MLRTASAEAFVRPGGSRGAAGTEVADTDDHRLLAARARSFDSNVAMRLYFVSEPAPVSGDLEAPPKGSVRGACTDSVSPQSMSVSRRLSRSVSSGP